MNLGQHAAFIWASYGAVAIVLSLLVGWLITDGRRQQQSLDAFEARGVRRRSSAGQATDPHPSPDAT